MRTKAFTPLPGIAVNTFERQVHSSTWLQAGIEFVASVTETTSKSKSAQNDLQKARVSFVIILLLQYASKNLASAVGIMF